VIRFFALAVIALAAGAAAAYYLRADTGYVLVSYGPWVVETSLLGFALSTAVALIIAVYGARFILAGLRLPTTLRQALETRRARRARESFEAGLQHLLVGDWRRAEIELARRAADHPDPALNYLLAARAAQRAGAPERRDHYLGLAERQSDLTEFAAHVARAELQLARKDVPSARTGLQALHDKHPKQPYVIELLAETLARSGEWEALRQLLARPERLRALTPERGQELLARAYSELLTRASASARLDALKSLWDAAPAPVRAHTAVRSAYARGLARVGAEAQAAALITQVLKTEWDPELVTVFGEMTAIDPLGQLATVEQWLSQHGEKPEVLLAAGRVCTRHGLWGKARSYLDAALRKHPSPEVCHALAQLCLAAKNPVEAQRFYQRGLELAVERK